MARSNLLRSIAFGLIPKLLGGLVVFWVLPIFIKSLSQVDYSLFLEGMALSSLVTLVFGTVNVPVIHYLIENRDRTICARGIAWGFRLFLGFFCLLLSLLVVGFFFFFGVLSVSRIIYFGFIILIAIVTSVIQFGDVSKLARGEDHIASIFQAIGSFFLICIVTYFNLADVWLASAVYYGIPFFVSLFVLIHEFQDVGERLSPVFSLPNYVILLRTSIGYFWSGFCDYFRIYLPGVLMLALGLVMDQIFYSTIILLVARLVNPLSLIMRPLVPYFIAALHNFNHELIRLFRLTLVLMPLVMFASFLIFSFGLYHFRELFKLYLNLRLTLGDSFFVSAMIFLQLYYGVAIPLYMAKMRNAAKFAFYNLVICLSLFLSFILVFLFFDINMIGVFLPASLLIPCFYVWRYFFKFDIS